jgi:2-keto-4-pentenoate hydratase/2-oxohepta-3-ene-1,7-dioic acid hydratase in catechol pathway
MEDTGMKAVRYGDPGAERPGLIDAAGDLRDLSHVIEDWTRRQLAPAQISRLASLDWSRLPIVSAPVRLGVPVTGGRKFIGIGLNFKDFAREAKRPLPAEPAVFTKAVSCITGPTDPVILPPDSTQTDWEVELGAVIGSTARYVEKARALDHVAGYVLVNDVSEREYQNDRGGTWDKGKGCDTFGPVGPWLVTVDEIPDPQAIDLWLEVNGRRYQDGNSRDMIFPVAELISYLSAFMTLEPGDIVTTGTPAGVGMSQTPHPVYLADGDLMRLGSSRLGVQEHRVHAWRAT